MLERMKQASTCKCANTLKPLFPLVFTGHLRSASATLEVMKLKAMTLPKSRLEAAHHLAAHVHAHRDHGTLLLHLSHGRL